MTANLTGTVKLTEISKVFNREIEDIAEQMEMLFKSESAPLPQKAKEQFSGLLKLIYEEIPDERNIKNSLSVSQKLNKITRLSSDLINSIEYKEFIYGARRETIQRVYAISFAAAKVIEGFYYIYESAEEEDNIDLPKLSKGVKLLSEGLRKYPKFINDNDYESLKDLFKSILEISKEITIKIQTEPLNKKVLSAYKKDEDIIYLNATSVLWLIEEFEKKSKIKHKVKFRKLSPKEQKEFMESLINIEDSSYSPEEEKAYEEMLNRLNNS